MKFRDSGGFMSRQPGTYATFETSEGQIVCRLFEKDAPRTVQNFIDLAEGKREWTHPVTRKKTSDKLYDGTILHRVTGCVNRKSTRLNSSHVRISYAVFCLKKKIR